MSDARIRATIERYITAWNGRDALDDGRIRILLTFVGAALASS